ncbi:hypothetical protein N826_31980 [Skermanella aerolata KACC 11604]|nr:hypothetical protein N826_31980 [Skermanella aerolata KACC 11604]
MKGADMPCLEARIVAAFKQAMEEGRTDVAEHLLCALETLCPDAMPDSTLAATYLTIGVKRAHRS